MKETKFLIKSLKAIAEAKDCRASARQFAQLMFPDSPAWSRVYKIGHGSTSGKGMWLWGGSYLSKLVDAGYCYRHLDEYCRSEYGLLAKGWDIVRATEKKNEKDKS